MLVHVLLLIIIAIFNGPKAITLNCNAKLFHFTLSAQSRAPHGVSCREEEKNFFLSRSDCAFQFSLDSAQNACKAMKGLHQRGGWKWVVKFFNV